MKSFKKNCVNTAQLVSAVDAILQELIIFKTLTFPSRQPLIGHDLFENFDPTLPL